MTVSSLTRPPVPCGLVTMQLPSSRDFDDGEADVGDVGHFEPIGADAARDLCAAFDQVAGDGRPGQTVEIVFVPAEVMDGGSDGERWVGNAAGDNDVGTISKRLHDGCGAEIRVGRYQAIADLADCRVGIEISKRRSRMRPLPHFAQWATRRRR